MKKILILFTSCMFILVGCSEGDYTGDTLSDKYNIGKEVELGGVEFNIYKVDDDNEELYLLAKNNIAITPFSDDEHSGSYPHSYEGSLVEDYVDEFVDGLENNGVKIKASGLIEKDDLFNLGFEHSDGLSGLPYRCNDVPEFVKNEDNYWVGGYCKYQTRCWVYQYESLDTQSCDDEYGVRPVIVVEPSEIKE